MAQAFVREQVTLTGELLEVATLIHAAEPNACIAGGAARSALYPALGPTDIDVFVFDEGSAGAVGRALVGAGYLPEFRALGSVPRYWRANRLFVEVIQRNYVWDQKAWHTPEQVISQFGYSAEQFALEYAVDGWSVVYTEGADYAVWAKVIEVVNIPHPIRSAYRLNKYGRKGYGVDYEEVLKIFRAFNSLPEDERERLLRQNGEPPYST